MPEKPRLAITLGDYNGIGPEVILKVLTDPRHYQFYTPIVFGSEAVLRFYAVLLGMEDISIRRIRSFEEADSSGALLVWDVLEDLSPKPEPGRVSAEAGRAAMRALEQALRACQEGHCAALVTAPISKEAIHQAGYGYPGHTEYLAEKLGVERYLMLMVWRQLRMAMVSVHAPLRRVPEEISAARILDRLELLDQSLRRDWGIARPKIAVLALNPHAGDGGLLGQEELEVIAPALEEARQRGILAFGPFPADGFFATAAYRRYDAVLAMYHDQAQIPFKILAFYEGVNYTAGLPIIRTSPDHGTAFDIAGKGLARPDSLHAALHLALELIRRRQAALTSPSS
ncbi:MAG: 4-hydroxythreonine-4-phosphate dehydrogenase PdxA [Bacteroidetes bacterium]|nr:4-hydroxythreonine-4-phosphate dehydrogenase PdxA [Rhodothermia bacterium]MCS7155700.1 4-hydroxythreonine-4-phosphate dehydrogenase PdxA [Bacteroidota bacterium]MCX7906559.1 4-hydroxythreonine-4-phosphate dehydrogenase PdxA [Bacteroidota bacterium]MDW8137160.1 4-hydroxythreonine-4-phosphate dehydrogenase PdxA [Bacteroidota bacterium]MDW8284970.1 4-hydroxythreonine-4-phosphate dehydrogenase PdxA [Bacteroidota bacterium]